VEICTFKMTDSPSASLAPRRRRLLADPLEGRGGDEGVHACPGQKPAIFGRYARCAPTQKRHTKSIDDGKRGGRVTAPGGPGRLRHEKMSDCGRMIICRTTSSPSAWQPSMKELSPPLPPGAVGTSVQLTGTPASQRSPLGPSPCPFLNQNGPK
jgi:hypothetical protein